MSVNLTVIAEMVAKTGREDDLQRQLMALVEPTHKDEGCVQYDLHRSTNEPGRFVFVENWTSRECLDKHLAAPHLQAFLKATPDLLAEPPRILTYERIA